MAIGWESFPCSQVSSLDCLGAMGSRQQCYYDDAVDRALPKNHCQRCMGRQRPDGEASRHLVITSKNHRHGRCHQRHEHEPDNLGIRRPVEATQEVNGRSDIKLELKIYLGSLSKHTVVGSQAVRGYREAQANESKVLIRDFLEGPDDYVMSIERYSVSLTSIVGWGRRIDRKNDIVAQQALKLMEAVDLIIPGLFIIEALPWLIKLPSWLYKFPSQLRLGSAIGARFFYLLTKEGHDAPQDNFAKLLINNQEKEGLTDLEVAGLAGNLLGGGVDTTSSTMISTILAMAYFPEVQKKAQAELDAVVGHDRSPNWEDLDTDSLPYITAIVKEVLRWRTVTILAGIPHANTKDFEYQGYHFPAGTNVTGNMWAIHRNERDFPDPDNFRPERFLNGLENPYPNSRGSNPFGWGRRQCSGQPLAEQGLIFSLGRMIWAFDIRPGLDEQVSVPATILDALLTR